MDMKIETFSAEETHALGKKLGSEAKPGDVLTLVGDLGVGKTVFTQGSRMDLESPSQSAAQHLPLCRYTRKADCHFIILMYTASVILKKWMRSVTRIVFTERV